MSIASLSNKPDLNLNVGSVNCTAITINGVPPSGTGNFSTPSNQNLDMNGNAINNVAILTIPGSTPAAGQVLASSDTAGTLEWITPQGGSGFPNPVTTDLDMNTHAISGITTCTADELNAKKLTIPGSTPAAGQVLASTDTAGTLEWVTGGGGGGNFSTPSNVALNMQKNKIENVGTISLSNGTNTNVISLTSPTVNADIVYTLPDAYPLTTGQVLASTTAGLMSWITAGGSTGGYAQPPTANLIMSNGGQFYNIESCNVVSLKKMQINSVTPTAAGLILATSDANGSVAFSNSLSNIDKMTVASGASASGKYLKATDANGTLAWDTPASGGGSKILLLKATSSASGGSAYAPNTPFPLTTAFSTTGFTYPCMVTFNCQSLAFTTISTPAAPNFVFPSIFIATTDNETFNTTIDSTIFTAYNGINSNTTVGFNTNNTSSRGFTISAYLEAAPASGQLFINMVGSNQNFTFASLTIKGALVMQAA